MSEPCITALRRRFQQLAARSGIRAEEFDHLHACYSAPGRLYHNWSHVSECLVQLDRVSGRLSDPLSVEIALWYHDAVYVNGSQSNERDSAELAYAALVQVDQPRARKVRSYILDTHYSEPERVEDNDLEYLKDIDHSSFAKPFTEFWEDAQRLLQENASGSPSEPDVAPMIAFYQSILDGEATLFRTDEFTSACLPQAHANLRRAIIKLQGLEREQAS